MSAKDEIKTEIITRTAMATLKVLSRLSDRSILKVMRGARRLVLDPATRAGMDELIDAFAAGPPNTTLIRRMVRESQYDELRDMMFGTFCFKEMDIEDF